MKIFRTIFIIAVVLVAAGLLFSIARSSVSMHVVPSLGEYVASSTNSRDATTTDQTSAIWMASSTLVRMLLSEGYGTTTPPISSAKNISEIIRVSTTTIKLPKIPVVATSTLDEGFVRAPKGIIRLLISRTPSTREHGLSGYSSIAPDQGMMFIFPRSGEVGFWMKDMKFPLDIVWIGSNRKILGITENISPDSYPKTFSSPGNVQFVLELNAGKAAEFGLKKGVVLSF